MEDCYLHAWISSIVCYLPEYYFHCVEDRVETCIFLSLERLQTSLGAVCPYSFCPRRWDKFYTSALRSTEWNISSGSSACKPMMHVCGWVCYSIILYYGPHLFQGHDRVKSCDAIESAIAAQGLQRNWSELQQNDPRIHCGSTGRYGFVRKWAQSGHTKSGEQTSSSLAHNVYVRLDEVLLCMDRLIGPGSTI